MVHNSNYMKSFKPLIFVCLLYLIVIPACIKNSVSVNYVGTVQSPDIVLPKPVVKRGELFLVSTTTQNPGTTVKWSIRPSDSTAIIPYGNEAYINISLAGTYIITASFYSPADPVNAYDSTHSTIIVNDSVYLPPAISDYDTVALAGQDVTIVPVYNSGTLQFIVQTANKYNCTSYIEAAAFWQYTLDPETLNFYFDSARVAVSKADCGGAKNPATVSFSALPISNGSHPINAVLTQNPQRYFEGTVVVTDSNYTFTWPYSSGITISPLQIKRN